jgi:hypothetical protein
VLDELVQLQQEFERVDLRPREGRIRAVTEPVVLEGVDLGRFAIELHPVRLSEHPDSSCFDCIALDPHPACSDESVTHPHVRDKCLCAGDASAPIAEALRQGRLCDAFVLVRSVLRTYNPHSPYVHLADWQGQSCGDCGGTARSDDLCYCECCERDVCPDCAGSCDLCDDSCCRGCLERDEVSRRDCCPSCRRSCEDCGRAVDQDHYDESSGLCPQCLAEEQELQRQEEEEKEEEKEEEGPPEVNQPEINHQPEQERSDEQPNGPRCASDDGDPETDTGISLGDRAGPAGGVAGGIAAAGAA